VLWRTAALAAGMLPYEPDAVSEREPFVRPLSHCGFEGRLGDGDVADSGNRPSNVFRVPIPQLHSVSHVGDFVEVRVGKLAE
jgi:hypothetical protein